MIKNIIAGYICLSIGSVIGFITAALLAVGKDKEENTNG